MEKERKSGEVSLPESRAARSDKTEKGKRDSTYLEEESIDEIPIVHPTVERNELSSSSSSYLEPVRPALIDLVEKAVGFFEAAGVDRFERGGRSGDEVEDVNLNLCNQNKTEEDEDKREKNGGLKEIQGRKRDLLGPTARPSFSTLLGETRLFPSLPKSRFEET